MAAFVGSAEAVNEAVVKQSRENVQCSATRTVLKKGMRLLTYHKNFSS